MRRGGVAGGVAGAVVVANADINSSYGQTDRQTLTTIGQVSEWRSRWLSSGAKETERSPGASSHRIIKRQRCYSASPAPGRTASPADPVAQAVSCTSALRPFGIPRESMGKLSIPAWAGTLATAVAFPPRIRLDQRHPGAARTRVWLQQNYGATRVQSPIHLVCMTLPTCAPLSLGFLSALVCRSVSTKQHWKQCYCYRKCNPNANANTAAGCRRRHLRQRNLAFRSAHCHTRHA